MHKIIFIYNVYSAQGVDLNLVYIYIYIYIYNKQVQIVAKNKIKRTNIINTKNSLIGREGS